MRKIPQPRTISTTDTLIKTIRAKVLAGHLTERQAALFFELLSDALADSLYHVADPYHFDTDVAKAYEQVVREVH